MQPKVIVVVASAGDHLNYYGVLDNGRMFYALNWAGRFLIKESADITDDITDAINGVDVYWHDWADEISADLSDDDVIAEISKVYGLADSFRFLKPFHNDRRKKTEVSCP